MEIGQAFTWATIIFMVPNTFMLIRLGYIFFVQRMIGKRVYKIAKSIKLNPDHVNPYLDSLHAVYWDFDKMVKHWWIWDINKMRNL